MNPTVNLLGQPKLGTVKIHRLVVDGLCLGVSVPPWLRSLILPLLSQGADPAPQLPARLYPNGPGYSGPLGMIS